MNTHRLIDWLKLSSMLVAAALLAGCDGAGDDAVVVDDAPLGAESTYDAYADGDADVIVEDDTIAEPEPVTIEPEPAPIDDIETP